MLLLVVYIESHKLPPIVKREYDISFEIYDSGIHFTKILSSKFKVVRIALRINNNLR